MDMLTITFFVIGMMFIFVAMFVLLILSINKSIQNGIHPNDI